jgi:hypothetical protein
MEFLKVFRSFKPAKHLDLCDDTISHLGPNAGISEFWVGLDRVGAIVIKFTARLIITPSEVVDSVALLNL